MWYDCFYYPFSWVFGSWGLSDSYWWGDWWCWW